MYDIIPLQVTLKLNEKLKIVPSFLICTVNIPIRLYPLNLLSTSQLLEYKKQQQQPSLIPLSGVGYMDRITP